MFAEAVIQVFKIDGSHDCPVQSPASSQKQKAPMLAL
jgi:hypothetical protein